MENTIKTLEAIASHYLKAAEHMRAAAWMQTQLDGEWRPDPLAAAYDCTDGGIADDHDLDPCELVEPMETIGREVIEPAGEMHATVGDALDRCREVLGWDPDTLATSDVIARVRALGSIEDVDCVLALEQARANPSEGHRRAVRAAVISMCSTRRAELGGVP